MPLRSTTKRRPPPAPVIVRPRTIGWLTTGPDRYVSWGRDTARNLTMRLSVELIGASDWRAVVGGAVGRPDVVSHARTWRTRDAAMDWCWCAIDPDAGAAAITHHIIARRP